MTKLQNSGPEIYYVRVRVRDMKCRRVYVVRGLTYLYLYDFQTYYIYKYNTPYPICISHLHLPLYT